MVRNVKFSRKGDELTITCNISKEQRDNAPLSKSEKTKVVATTGGFVAYEDIGINLNVSVAK